ncbi:MAG: protein kinase [Gemmatimonadales bacterium]
MRPTRRCGPASNARRSPARGLSHPHIVPTYAVAEAAGRPYLVMGYIDGESLAQRLHRAGPLPGAEGERVIREVAWALGHAHATGVLHRDVTLDNILLERSTGRAVLVDFGIAALVDGDGDGTLLGTPAYLAPGSHSG